MKSVFEADSRKCQPNFTDMKYSMRNKTMNLELFLPLMEAIEWWMWLEYPTEWLYI